MRSCPRFGQGAIGEEHLAAPAEDEGLFGQGVEPGRIESDKVGSVHGFITAEGKKVVFRKNE
jgi:hypothetical protein